MDERHLVVVGGGITGLAAAWEASSDPGVRVTLLEAGGRTGGKIHTSDIVLDDGTVLTVDEGADAFLARVPDAVELCGELGLADELTQPAVGRAKVFVDGELRFLPEDTVLGVPTDMDALATSGLLSADGLAAAAAELDRTDDAPEGDVLEVSICDDGTGLPPGFRPSMAGLGTQIVVSLVSDLRGVIRWEENHPRGTCVRFSARLRSLDSADE